MKAVAILFCIQFALSNAMMTTIRSTSRPLRSRSNPRTGPLAQFRQYNEDPADAWYHTAAMDKIMETIRDEEHASLAQSPTLRLAVCCGDRKVIEGLMANPTSLAQEDVDRALWEALGYPFGSRPNLKLMGRLLGDLKADPNSRYSPLNDKDTLLVWAIYRDNRKLIRLLIRHGARLDLPVFMTDDWGLPKESMLPVELASRLGKWHLVDVLKAASSPKSCPSGIDKPGCKE